MFNVSPCCCCPLSVRLSVSGTSSRMETKTRKPFSPKGGKKFTQRSHGELPSLQDGRPDRCFHRTCLLCPDSKTTTFGGKPGGRKPPRAFSNAEKKSRSWKTGDPSKQKRLSSSAADGGAQERRRPPKRGADGPPQRGADGQGGPAGRSFLLLTEDSFTAAFLSPLLSASVISVCVCVWAGPEAKKMKKGEFKPAVKKTTKEELKRNRQQRKKEVKKQRQQTERKDMFDVICQAKKVWGSLRRYTRTHTHRNHGGGPPSPAGVSVLPGDNSFHWNPRGLGDSACPAATTAWLGHPRLKTSLVIVPGLLSGGLGGQSRPGWVFMGSLVWTGRTVMQRPRRR